MPDDGSLTRVQWWDKHHYKTHPMLQGGEDDCALLKAFGSKHEAYEQDRSEIEEGLGGLLQQCKEIIFDVKDGEPVFSLVMFGVDLETGMMTVGVSLELSFGEEESKEETEDDNAWNEAKNVLATAKLCGVPVLANHAAVEDDLVRCFRELLNDGFKVTLEPGSAATHLKLGAHLVAGPAAKSLSLTRHWSPAEHDLLRHRLVKELKAADATLGLVRQAIEDLTNVLARKHTEHDLQRCLETNPMLFGLDYQRIISKHRFGSEFVTDFSLERFSGVVDLVEIEGSGHRLFTNKSTPTSPLIHAEQQVLDWLDWIEQVGPYARARLPRLLRPQAYIVIGRRSSMSERQQRLLIQRNQIFRGAFEIMTYDDLLDQAEVLLAVLQGRQ